MQWFSEMSIYGAAAAVALATFFAFVFGFKRGNGILEDVFLLPIIAASIYVAVGLGKIAAPFALQILFFLNALWGFLRFLILTISFVRDPSNYLWSVRFSRSMSKVGRLAPSLDSALRRTEQRYGQNGLTARTRVTFVQLGGQPGDGALEVLDDLEKDIETTRALLQEWVEVGELGNLMCPSLERFYQALCDLRLLVRTAPQSFLDASRKRISQQLSR